MLKTWSQEEIDTLVRNYNKVSNQDLHDLLPNKSEMGIYKKAYKMGLRKTPEIQFLNRSLSRKGSKGSKWNGGKRVTRKGYRQLLMPGHHRADVSGYVMEHIVVWEDFNNMQVPTGYIVHHINGIKDDNRPENLALMKRGEHTVFHHKGIPLSDSTKQKISESRRAKYA
jgi:hypothetical protein